MDKYAKLHEKIALFEVLAFSQEILYGPYKRKSDGRDIVIVRDQNRKVKTKTLAKHLMEKHLGRELDPNKETVDHIDSNKDNNALDNLKVIDRKEHSRQDTKRVKNIKLKCVMCGNDFERSPRLLRDKAKKGNTGPFCSRSCSGKYNRLVQLKKMDKVPVQPHMESEYYKQKYADDQTTSREELDPYNLPEDFEPSGLWEDVLMQYGEHPHMSILLQILKEHEIKAHAIGKNTISVMDLGGDRKIIPANLTSVMVYLGY